MLSIPFCSIRHDRKEWVRLHSKKVSLSVVDVSKNRIRFIQDAKHLVIHTYQSSSPRELCIAPTHLHAGRLSSSQRLVRPPFTLFWASTMTSLSAVGCAYQGGIIAASFVIYGFARIISASSLRRDELVDDASSRLCQALFGTWACPCTFHYQDLCW